MPAFAPSPVVVLAAAHSPPQRPLSRAPARSTPRPRPRLRPRAALPPPAPAHPPHTFQGVTWAEVERMCDELAAAAAGDHFDVVLGITRGGMVPATLLCEALRLRNMLSATVMFYTDAGDQFYGMTEPRFLAFPSTDALEGRRVLVVDDVWDSGRTAHSVMKRVERAAPDIVKVAVLHFKPSMNVFKGVTPDFYCAVTDNWVVYPWEKPSPDAPKIEVKKVNATPLATDQESAPISGTG